MNEQMRDQWWWCHIDTHPVPVAMVSENCWYTITSAHITAIVSCTYLFQKFTLSRFVLSTLDNTYSLSPYQRVHSCTFSPCLTKFSEGICKAYRGYISSFTMAVLCLFWNQSIFMSLREGSQLFHYHPQNKLSDLVWLLHCCFWGLVLIDSFPLSALHTKVTNTSIFQ